MLRATWQDHGYYKAKSKGEAQLLASADPRRHLVVLTVQVDEGRKYRLDGIRFTNANVLSTAALRAMVPLQDDEILSVEKIRE